MNAGSSVKRVVKRDGRVVRFERGKITAALQKAAQAVNQGDEDLASRLTEKVVTDLEGHFDNSVIPTVEDIQNRVEQVLIENHYGDIARAYILYRQRRAEVRQAKRFIGVQDDLKLPINAVKVLKERYLLKDEAGKIIESPAEMFRRVARAVADVDSLYEKNADVEARTEEFFEMLKGTAFLPNSPTLMNAGTPVGQLSACFVLPVEDSLEGIFDTLKNMARIHQSGGGTGFSFSKLRPAGDVVQSTRGIASGPVSFMRIFDSATDVVKQGGRRRGANMGVLRVDHPDIETFITSKEREDFLPNFNISVATPDEWMRSVNDGRMSPLVNPRSGRSVGDKDARDLFNLIVTMAWRTGDPGLIFLDRVNAANPTPRLGDIESTNPCGEQPLLPFESCNLGSINLSVMLSDGKIDWARLRATVRTAVHFLDNVIDANRFPLPEIERITKANRKIGLGVMGWAEFLAKQSIAYDSEAALDLAAEVMKQIGEEAREYSHELARVRGPFPNFAGSRWDEQGYRALRNATLTTVAPTGTISIIAGTSSGIEPLFAISFIRDVMEGTRLLEVNPVFEAVAKRRGFFDRKLMMDISKKGSLQGFQAIPPDVRRAFVTAFEVSPEWHVRTQAVFQKHVDNAVSKTVNLPPDASLEDVRRVFLLAYELGCKGITVYRYGSKKEQVLYLGSEEYGQHSQEAVRAGSEFAGGCPGGPSGNCPY